MWNKRFSMWTKRFSKWNEQKRTKGARQEPGGGFGAALGSGYMVANKILKREKS